MNAVRMVLGAWLLVMLSAPARADSTSLAAFFPRETVMYASAGNWGELEQRIAKLYQPLWKESAVQAFLKPGLDEWKKTWGALPKPMSEAGEKLYEMTKKGVALGVHEFPKKKGDEFGVVLIAEAGDKAPDAFKHLNTILSSPYWNGKFRFKQEKLNGSDVLIFTEIIDPARIQLAERSKLPPPKPMVVAAGVEGGHMVVALTQKAFAATQRLIKNPGAGGLKGNPDFQAAFNKVRKHAASFGYFSMVELVKFLGSDPSLKEIAEYIKVSRISSGRAIGGGLDIAEKDSTVQVFVLMPGARAGLLRAIPAENKPVSMARLAPANAASFVEFHLDPVALWNEGWEWFKQTQRVKYYAARAWVAEQEEKLKINIEKDVMGNFTGSFAWFTTYTQPYSWDGQSIAMVARVSDAKRLEEIMRQLVDKSEKFDLKSREYLNANIVELVQKGFPPGGQTPHYAFVGDVMVLSGGPDGVEQVIRLIGKEGKSFDGTPDFKQGGGLVGSSGVLYQFESGLEKLKYYYGLAKTPNFKQQLYRLGLMARFVDWSRLPPYKLVSKYAVNNYGLVENQPDGLLWTTRAPLP
ncbi:MAG: hypothetical protein GMKNLPBB_00564 [Myxococcota bacterium]|nr:hypothetical protein [Myxococcota bacterium]